MTHWTHRAHQTRRILCYLLAALVAALLVVPTLGAASFITDGSFKGEKGFVLELAAPMDQEWDWQNNVIAYERQSPDIRTTVSEVVFSPDRKKLTVLVEESVSDSEAYVVRLKGILAQGKALPDAEVDVRTGVFLTLLTIILTASLIQNFVFARYLGLCVFFGTSARKDTAVGMGVSFFFVVVLSAVFVWAMYSFVLKPLHLEFLQVLTFVGIIAVFVQFLDTVLRKVNPYLFKTLGVYLVLITTNCIILAVPLILVGNAYNVWESLALAVGTGIGFFIAIFLMACVRERLDVADVPSIFKGLPIAFIVAGLFALAFLGFSGMKV